jgi:hypothetical protein
MAGADCDAKWSRAVSWVTTNSEFTIQTQTAQIIQTMGPLRQDPTPALTVTKVAVASGDYEITFASGCDNFIGSVPEVADERAKFAAFVAGR